MKAESASRPVRGALALGVAEAESRVA